MSMCITVQVAIQQYTFYIFDNILKITSAFSHRGYCFICVLALGKGLQTDLIVQVQSLSFMQCMAHENSGSRILGTNETTLKKIVILTPRIFVSFPTAQSCITNDVGFFSYFSIYLKIVVELCGVLMHRLPEILLQVKVPYISSRGIYVTFG